MSDASDEEDPLAPEDDFFEQDGPGLFEQDGPVLFEQDGPGLFEDDSAVPATQSGDQSSGTDAPSSQAEAGSGDDETDDGKASLDDTDVNEASDNDADAVTNEPDAKAPDASDQGRNPATEPVPAAPLALYRRYRPDTFEQVIGQEHVTEPLQRAIANNRVNHAYLFSGPRGCGKTTSARILARCLNCELGPTPTPCGHCRSCRDLATGGPGSIDVIEIDAASHGRVDDARELREGVYFAPVHSRYKIYIIDEAHMVTKEGFNALLKVVEEPPEHVKFIFATTEPEKVIGTIRSRTHHYPFRLVPPKVLTQYLAQICDEEGVQVEAGVLPLVVRAGAGSVRDSLSVLDQLLGAAGENGVSYRSAAALLGYTPDALLDEMIDAMAAGDGKGVFGTVDKVIEIGQDPRRFAEDLLSRLRDLVIIAKVPDALSSGLIDVAPDLGERLEHQAAGLGAGELTRAADVMAKGLTQMRGTTAPRLHLELMCARVLLPGADDDERGIHARLDRIERRMGMSDAPLPGDDARSGDTPGQGGNRPVEGGRSDGGTQGGRGQGGRRIHQIPGAQPDHANEPYQAPAAQESASPESAYQEASSQAPSPQAGAGYQAEAPAQAGQVPAQQRPAQQRPAGSPPAQQRPAQQRPAGQRPAGEPAQQRPAGQPPVDQRPAGQSPSGQRPAGEPPAGQRPAQQRPASQPPVGEPPSWQPQAPAPSAQRHADQTTTRQPQATTQPQPDASSSQGNVQMTTVEMRRLWPDVLKAVESTRRFLYILLSQNAQVLDVNQNELTLVFNNQGARESFNKPNSEEILRECIGQVTGVNLTITSVVEGEAALNEVRRRAQAVQSSEPADDQQDRVPNSHEPQGRSQQGTQFQAPEPHEPEPGEPEPGDPWFDQQEPSEPHGGDDQPDAGQPHHDPQAPVAYNASSQTGQQGSRHAEPASNAAPTSQNGPTSRSGRPHQPSQPHAQQSRGGRAHQIPAAETESSDEAGEQTGDSHEPSRQTQPPEGPRPVPHHHIIAPSDTDDGPQDDPDAEVSMDDASVDDTLMSAKQLLIDQLGAEVISEDDLDGEQETS